MSCPDIPKFKSPDRHIDLQSLRKQFAIPLLGIANSIKPVLQPAGRIFDAAFHKGGDLFLCAYAPKINPESKANYDEATRLLIGNRKRVKVWVSAHLGHSDHPLNLKAMKDQQHAVDPADDRTILVVASQRVWGKNNLLSKTAKVLGASWGADCIFVVQDYEIIKEGFENDPKRVFTEEEAKRINFIAFRKVAKLLKHDELGGILIYEEGTRADEKTRIMHDAAGSLDELCKLVKDCVVVSVNPSFKGGGRNGLNLLKSKRLDVARPYLIENGQIPQTPGMTFTQSVMTDIAEFRPPEEQGPWAKFVKSRAEERT